MQPSLTSPQQRQRLMTRFNYLLRQYKNLRTLVPVFSALAGGSPGEWAEARQIEAEFARQRGAIERDELETARRGLGAIEAALQDVRQDLSGRYDSLSAYLLRMRYQQPGARREEVAALLEFLLSKSPREEGDLDKLDYLATRLYALSCANDLGFVGAFENRVRGEFQEMLDQAGVTTAGAPDPGVMERFQFFRDEFSSLATFEQLSTQDTLGRLREFKAGLKERLFHPDMLIEVARVNLLAGRRFQELANSERQCVDRLARSLLSAGVSEVEQPDGGGKLPVEDAREISALNASLLDQDYRRNKERLTRIAHLKGALERVHEGLSPHDKRGVDPGQNDFLAAAEIEELEAILDDLSPTPERLQQDLCARINQLSLSLSEAHATTAGVTLPLGGSSLTLAPWECAAFRDDQSADQLRAARLRRIIRVGVALVAEVQEKAELICRGLAVGRLRNTYLIGARYLVQLSQQTARELELRCHNTDDALDRELCEQLHQSRRKLLESCSQFSAKVRNAAA